MEYTVSYRTYLSKETTQSLKRLLDKTKAISEIQVNGTVYMERKDYRMLQNIDEIANDNNFRQIKPVYGAVQLLNLFVSSLQRALNLRIFILPSRNILRVPVRTASVGASL